MFGNRFAVDCKIDMSRLYIGKEFQVIENTFFYRNLTSYLFYTFVNVISTAVSFRQKGQHLFVCCARRRVKF